VGRREEKESSRCTTGRSFSHSINPLPPLAAVFFVNRAHAMIVHGHVGPELRAGRPKKWAGWAYRGFTGFYRQWGANGHQGAGPHTGRNHPAQIKGGEKCIAPRPASKELTKRANSRDFLGSLSSANRSIAMCSLAAVDGLMVLLH